MDTILANALGPDSSAVAEKRDLLERLLARLAHEIRNPLSSLDIHVQLLEEDLAVLAPANHEHLGPRLAIIRGELHRLESIVGHFLRLAGPSALDLEPVHVGKLLKHVCELLGPEAAAREIVIGHEVDAGLQLIMADPVRLTQALMNMVINAMQAVEQKGRVNIVAGSADGKVSISVADNGPGIPLERMASIFDPYFTTKSEGTGLGLWIAQQIVAAHGGKLTAQNGPVRGAVFTMSFPLTPVPAAEHG